ncbi:MAG: response regulator [Spirochaetales bacterium]|nr:response regulator [Spirochaetales bacterium]
MDTTNILIVEDEAIVAADISLTLKKMGYKIPGICSSGREALVLLSTIKVDIILMDIHIKGDIDGIELATKIHHDMRIPVIFLTAYSDDETLERAKMAQPFGYLSKSFYYKDIKTTIETALYRFKMKLQVEEKEELLSLTLKSIDEAVITVEESGVLLFYNRRAEEIFSLPKFDSDRKISSLLPDYLEFYSDSGEPLEDILILPELPQRITLVKPLEKLIIPLECSVSKNLRTERGFNQNVYVFRDISNVQKIREMESLLSAVVESSEDVIAALSLHGIVKSWNNGAEKIFRIKAEDAIGEKIYDLLPQVLFPDFIKSKNELKTMEFFHHADPEDSKFISVHLTPFLDVNNVVGGYSLIGRDLTSRTNLERKITQAEESIRTRIGRDLHDNLGQQLTGISLKLQALRNGISRENYESVEKISIELADLIKEAIRETRELSRGLIPAILRNEGLPHALKNLSRYLERVYGVTTECNLDNTLVLDESVASQLFHIAQESVNNAVKHGMAENIILNLRREPEGAIMEIIDNGSGFSEKLIKRGLGLDNMRYRADIIRGNLDIISILEKGTTVSCRIMMQSEKGAGLI